MHANFPPETRGVWPYEKNKLMDFTAENTSDRIESPLEVALIFKDMITELLDETIPDVQYANPDLRRVLAFSVTSNGTSEVLVIVVKQALDSEHSDQIIVQDRLFGKVRDEYVYMSTEGRDGDIVRIRCGDIAVLDHSAEYSIQDIPKELRVGTHEQLVSIAELDAVMSLAMMGEHVDTATIQVEQLNYPHQDAKYEGNIDLLVPHYST